MTLFEADRHSAAARRPSEMPPGEWRFRLVLLAFSFAGAALIMLSTSRYGAGLGPDAVNYISAARSLAAGRGFIGFLGTPLVYWPPLYPIILASVSLVTRLDPLSFAHVVNALLFGVMVYLSGLLFAQHLARKSALLPLGMATVLTSTPLVDSSVSAMSELPFICCALAFLIAAHSYTRRGNWSSLIGMSLAAASASLLRWPGVILVPVGVLHILLHANATSRVRLLHASVLSIISAVPILTWLVVAMGSGHFLMSALSRGPGSSVAASLLESCRLVATTVLSWFVRRSRHGLAWARDVSLVIIVGTTAVAVLIPLWRAGVAGLWSSVVALLRRAGHLVLFVALYALLIVFSHVTVQEEINSRLLSPIYVPVIVLLFVLLDKAIERLRAPPLRSNDHVGLLAVACVWLLTAVIDAGSSALERRRSGAGGYSTVGWRESPTIDFVEQLAPSARSVLYTNAPAAFYILSGIAARPSPATRYQRLEGTEKVWPEEGSGLLVWFSHTTWEGYLTPAELQSHADLDTIATLDDGVIYSVSRRR